MRNRCRFCGFEEVEPFLDLGFSPPSNAYLGVEDLSREGRPPPLRVVVCPLLACSNGRSYSSWGDTR